MSNSTIIKNARLINEGKDYYADLTLTGERIENIASSLSAVNTDNIVDARGMYLLPGMIDDQVHFREPGLTHKGSIASESSASVAGGITSYMEMPNVNPATTTIAALEAKYQIAGQHSVANYAFYLGATEQNLEQIKRLNPTRHCGVKVFMGASTGNLLVEEPTALEAIFREAPGLIVTHCESGAVISQNKQRLSSVKDTLTIHDHPVLRDSEACYASSSYAVALAKQFHSQLHVLHITTARELALFDPGPIANKHITAEACVHHLWFSDEDYDSLGNLIKCNPAIKTPSDRNALMTAVNEDIIDIIATDHAPHTWQEKQAEYSAAPSGLPLVQHALLTLLDHANTGKITLPKLVEKVAHNPAKRYGVIDRGFLREGYFADLVLVDPHQQTPVSHHNCLYKCGWTPFDEQRFSARIAATWVNGQLVFDGSTVVSPGTAGQRLSFNKL